MTTDIQKIIDSIPLEGKAPFHLPAEAHEELALKAFVGKTPPAPGETKKAIILFGHPGSGKSWIGIKAYEHMPAYERDKMVVISYDEDGAIESIPGFQRDMKALGFKTKYMHKVTDGGKLKERRDVWQDYQSDSQRIRSLSLKKALRGGYNTLIDTTSTSRGTAMLIDAKRGIGYEHIEMIGAFSPFKNARDRVEKRVRPTSAIGDLVGKRIGAYEWLNAYAGYVDKFTFYYNPSNKQAPVAAFVMEKGEPLYTNSTAIQSIQHHMVDEADSVRAYLNELRDYPDRAAPERIETHDIEPLMQRHQKMVMNACEFLEQIRTASLKPRGPAPTV